MTRTRSITPHTFARKLKLTVAQLGDLQNSSMQVILMKKASTYGITVVGFNKDSIIISN